MKKILLELSALLAALVALVSCDNLGIESRNAGQFDRVFIICSLGYNNLSNSLAVNLDSLAAGNIPSKDSRDAIVVYKQATYRSGDYTTPTMPSVYRLYKEDGKPVEEILGYYPSGTVAGSVESLGEALRYIQEMMPSKSYSMLVTSHGTGWLPPAYKEAGISVFSAGRETPKWPETKSLGAQFVGSSSNTVEMELKAFAKAIPMKLDYLILDACLMGGAEVAYELKDVCDMIVASPTEILTKGFIYETMSERLFGSSQPDLQGICEDYFNYYLSQTGSYRSATITLVDCSGMEKLASVFGKLVDAHRSSIASIYRAGVQAYFYDSKHWFYDLRHFAVKFGATASELAELDEALAGCVKYKAATDTFFSLELKNVCGLSVYIPDSSWDELNEYYKSLAWNSATCLVK